jgi:hypothetical protein
MKAILEFDLPEEENEHKAALAGHDALKLLDELVTEIAERIDNEEGCTKTLDQIWDWIVGKAEIRGLRDFI